MICNLTDTGEEIVGLLDVNTNQVAMDTARELAGDLLAVLTEAAADPARPLPPVGDRAPLY